jgi:hypothetical protein
MAQHPGRGQTGARGRRQIETNPAIHDLRAFDVNGHGALEALGLKLEEVARNVCHTGAHCVL